MPGVERILLSYYRGIFENNESKCLEYLEYVFEKKRALLVLYGGNH
jgi:4-aminobutyrate aminotransferase